MNPELGASRCENEYTSIGPLTPRASSIALAYSFQM